MQVTSDKGCAESLVTRECLFIKRVWFYLKELILPNVSIPIAIQRKAEVIQRIANGEMVKDIAKDLGCHPTAITHALKGDQDYLDAQIAFHSSRIDNAEEMILAADDSVSCTRAIGYHKAVSWRASVEQRRIWGQQPSVVVMPGADIRSLLDEREARIAAIDGQCEKVGGEGKADV